MSDPAIDGKNVLLLGVGLIGGGIGMARYLHRHGAKLRITDLRTAEVLRPTLDALSDIESEYVLGEHREEDIRWADLIVANPGVAPNSRYLLLARELGTPIEMELSYFTKHCPARVTAVTGTKGKTTTTMLLHQLLEADGSHVHLAGNMGVPAITLLDELTADDQVLLEISCQQLEGRLEEGWSPDVAVITNVEDDHIERYGSVEAYRRVKASLVMGQSATGATVLPGWDRGLLALCADVPSTKTLVRDPERPFHDDVLEVAAVVELDGDALRRVGRDGTVEELCQFDAYPLRGRHNRLNLTFAAAAAYANGRSAERIAGVVPSLRPVEHRLQTVGVGAGITYVNDSAATAPIAVVSALEALSSERVVLICGGVGKGSDFAPMVAAIEKSVTAVVLLPGTGTDLLLGLLADYARTAPVGTVADMPAAVGRAVELARAKDATCVLLSPGCASFGLFRNEFDRGNAFMAAARTYLDD